MKNRRSRRLGKLLGLPVLAVCGFAIAATLASVGLAETTTTDTSTNSTTVSTTTTTTTPNGAEGCTPGFWKNNADKKDASQWTAPYDPDNLVSSVFDQAPADIGSLTLLEGLQLGGGGLNALTRHAIAAVLNAAHPEIDYPFTVVDIVISVNAAYNGLTDVEVLKDLLDVSNNLGCDISQNTT